MSTVVAEIIVAPAIWRDYDRRMKTEDAVKYFGTQTRIAELIGITRQAVSAWPEVVPQQWQYHLERLSAGKLRPEVPLPEYALPPASERVA
jgi:hypothetical protein